MDWGLVMIAVSSYKETLICFRYFLNMVVGNKTSKEQTHAAS